MYNKNIRKERIVKNMIRVGDRARSMLSPELGTGTVVAVQRGKKLVMVKWDIGLVSPHYLHAVKKVEK